MINLLSDLSSGTIISIVITALILAVLFVFFIVWLLWKKNKVNGKIDGFMYKSTNYFSGFSRQANSKLITNSSKGEKAMYWIVILSGGISAIMLLALEITNGYYTMSFLRTVFFILFLVFMIAFNFRIAPVSPYYYEYNPNLFFYSAISLFFAFLDFFIGLGNTINFGIVLPIFIGNLMFFGTIFLTRFSKTEFKPRNILVYLGAMIVIVVQTVSFGLSSFNLPLRVVYNVFSYIYNAGFMVLLTFFYDDFAFIKKVFRK